MRSADSRLPRLRRDLVRVLALVALAISAALVANQLWPGPGLCGYDSSCALVQDSWLGHILPGLGLLTFTTLFVSSLVTAPWALKLQRGLAILVCMTGMALFLWQGLVIGAFCPYCLVVDGAGVAIGIIECVGNRVPRYVASPFQARLLWSGAAVLAVILGVGISILRSDPTSAWVNGVPPEVRALWVPGKVNIVEVADFQCPQCRRMHAVLQQFLREQGNSVHFELVVAPLPRHAQARDAGRAYLCAQELGQGEKMAEVLFVAEHLLPADCEHFASVLRVPMASYRTCVKRSDIDDRLDQAYEWSTVASPQGLPVTWVQEKVLFGVQSLQALRDAVQQAEHARSESEGAGLNKADSKSKSLKQN